MSYRPLIMTIHHHLSQQKAEADKVQVSLTEKRLKRTSIPRIEKDTDQIKKQRYAPM